MSFLDPNYQIIDMILTEEGKKSLAAGKLNFSFYAFFDDEIDYDPYVSNSASLSAIEYTASQVSQIENSPVREAVSGKKFDIFALDRTNVNHPLFTIPQGQEILPKIIKVHRTSSLDITVNQQKVVDKYSAKNLSVARGYNRFGANQVFFEYLYTPNSFPPEHVLEGLKVTLFASSSAGLVELPVKFDADDQLVFDAEMKLIDQQRRKHK